VWSVFAACAVQPLPYLCGYAQIGTLPKGAERVLRIFSLRASLAPRAQFRRACGRLIHEIDVAIGASREALPVFSLALRAEHAEPQVYYNDLISKPLVLLSLLAPHFPESFWRAGAYTG